MEISKRLDTLESDFKLMKGELKETLSNVRDYLTEIKFPPPVDIDVPSFGDETTITMKGALGAAAAPAQPIIIQGSSLMAPQAPAAAGPAPPAPAPDAASPAPPAASAPSPAPPAPSAPSPMPPTAAAGPAQPDVVEYVVENPPEPAAATPEPSAVQDFDGPASLAGQDLGGPPPLSGQDFGGPASSEAQDFSGSTSDDNDSAPPMPRMEDVPMEEAISQSFETNDRFGSSETPEWPLYEEIEDLGRTGLDDRDYGKKVTEEVSQAAPGVNLLANLIRWVATAKREIDSEKLLTLLEVYGISGHLSPELKEVILHLEEITEQQSVEESAADIWSRLTLELHGILGGGDGLPRIMKPVWDEDESDTPQSDMVSEENTPEEKTLKLKLVLSSGDEDKEFSIDLNPESNTPG